MKRLLLALVALVCSAFVGAQTSQTPATQADALAQAVQAEVAHGFSGAVMIMRGGEIVLNELYGSEDSTVIPATQPFWIASAAKQFTSAAILRCAEQGLLSLDDPLSRFFPTAPRDKQKITVRQLLTHTSGLPQSYVSEGQRNRASAVRRMLAEPLIGVPGARFAYSNNNFQLAVAIVEVLSGKRYGEYVRSELWNRAGLVATGFAGDTEAKRVSQVRGKPPLRLTKREWGGEGVYSSTGDLANWYRALRDGKILSAANVAELFKPTAPIQEGFSALGWFVGATPAGSTRIFTRGNEDFGANSLLYAYPASNTIVIVLTHAGDAPKGQSWSRAIHARLESLLGL